MSIRRTMALVATAAVGLVSSTAAMAPVASAVTTATVTRQVQAGITLNVRTGPGTSYSIAGKFTGGAMVTGTISGSWLKITTGSYTGKYVSTTYLVAPAPAPVQPTSGQKVGYVMADPSGNGTSVNVRAAMSFNSAIVGHYAPSARVVGTPQGDGTWWKVPGGYIHSGVLETTTATPSTINARIPLTQLCKIPIGYNSQNGTLNGYKYTPTYQRYIQCKALPNLINLENAFKAHFGFVAQIDNAYRDWAEQAYWVNYYKGTSVPVSAPGKSNHGFGLAIDFRQDYGDGYRFFEASPKNQPGRAWLVANASKYGFAPLGVYDAVHFNFVG